jgi:drug/metabolite transporter (DMT)-like permease
MAAALALLTSLCYGLSNFAGPLLSRDLPVYAVLMAGQVVALAVSAVVVAVSGVPVPEASVWGAAALAGAGNAWGLIAFYRAAKVGPLSLVVPLGSLGAVIPVLVGASRGEPLGAVKVAGLLLALGGVALAGRRTSAPVPEHHDLGAAVRWALASVLGFGVFLTFIADAAEGGVFWAVALSRLALLIALALAAVVLAERVAVPLSRVPHVALPGVLLFAGTVAYAVATRHGDLSVVSVLGSLFPVVTVTMAFVFLGERLSRLQGVGVGAALAGVVLVSAHL